MQEIELKRPPTQMEVFFRTHTKKEDGTWVDARSERTYVSLFMYWICLLLFIITKIYYY